jgi:hypothetical protein
MQIMSTQGLDVMVWLKGADGTETRKKIRVHPGSREYPQINHKDPRVASQLEIFRKHKVFSFAEILPGDLVKEVDADGKETGKTKIVQRAVNRSRPIRKVATPALTEETNKLSKRREASLKKKGASNVVNAAGNPGDEGAPSGTGADGGGDKGGGPVSGKTPNKGR